MQMIATDHHAVAQAFHDVGSALWYGGSVNLVQSYRAGATAKGLLRRLLPG